MAQRASVTASATPGAAWGCHETPASAPDGVRGRAFGVAAPADGALGRAPRVPPWSLTNSDQKHTAPGDSLPDFSLQIPCKCAVEAVVWMTAGATGAAQQVARGLPHLMPPLLGRAACDVRLTAHGLRSGKIPAKGGLVVEARSQRSCNLSYTPLTPRRVPHTPSHAS
jgi:hypothetical protein